MNKFFLVAAATISLQLSAMTLTCVETKDGYPMARLMLQGDTAHGYTLAHQSVGNTFFDTTETLFSENMNCHFSPRDGKLMSCQESTETGSVDMMTRRVDETVLNNFFGMMTTVKTTFLEFDVAQVQDGMNKMHKMRFPLAACKLQKDKAQEEPVENSDV